MSREHNEESPFPRRETRYIGRCLVLCCRGLMIFLVAVISILAALFGGGHIPLYWER